MTETFELQSFWRCLKCNYESDSPNDFKAPVPKEELKEKGPLKRVVCPNCGLVYDE